MVYAHNVWVHMRGRSPSGVARVNVERGVIGVIRRAEAERVRVHREISWRFSWCIRRTAPRLEGRFELPQQLAHTNTRPGAEDERVCA